MNMIIRKFKDVNINIKSSRKIIVIKSIPIFIIAILVFAIAFSFKSEEGITISYAMTVVTFFIFIFCFDLFHTDWTAKTKDKILFIRKWIFKYKIQFKDLINISKEHRRLHGHRRSYDFLIIKYKKGNKIQNLRIDFLERRYFLLSIRHFYKIEYAKESEIIEFMNVFLRQGELLEDKKETNILLTDYKDIRTEQEEKEIYNLLNKTANREEKIIWILLFAIIIIPIVLLILLYKFL